MSSPSYLLILMLIAPLSYGLEPRFFSQEDIMTDFHQSWEAAGRFLGLDTSKGVASLVSSSFGSSPVAGDKQDSTPPASTSLFHGFFRLLGFDTDRLNAIAVNAVVFIAKMIGNTFIKNLTGPNPARSIKDEITPGESPLTWILADVQEQAQPLLARAQDPRLPDQLISALQATPAHTDCIQLLVCRSTPFLNGMQRSLADLLEGNPSSDSWASLSPLQRMYHYIPSRRELVDSASECRSRIPSCSQLFTAFED